MDDKTLKLAQQEVTLLKVLVALTIIRYYDSWEETEDKNINILMEYASGGTLYDKIKSLQKSGNQLTE